MKAGGYLQGERLGEIEREREREVESWSGQSLKTISPIGGIKAIKCMQFTYVDRLWLSLFIKYDEDQEFANLRSGHANVFT